MKSDSDEPPSPRSTGVDTNEFFLPGAGLSALLIHGLTGTPYEMRYLGERLASRGVRVRGVHHFARQKCHVVVSAALV